MTSFDKHNSAPQYDKEGRKKFEQEYGLPVEQFLASVSIVDLLKILRELGIKFTNVKEEGLIENYEFQTIAETIDAETISDTSKLIQAIEKAKQKSGLAPSFFKENVIDYHAQLPKVKFGPVVLEPLSFDNLKDIEKRRRQNKYYAFVSRGGLTTFSHLAFIAELVWQFKTSRDTQMLVRDKDSNPIGTVFSYNVSRADKRGFFSLFIDEQTAPTGTGIYAATAFLEFMFEKDGLEVVYIDVYDNNTHMLAILDKLGIPEVGYFKKWRVQDSGEYIGMKRFAIEKAAFDKLSQKLHSK